MKIKKSFLFSNDHQIEKMENEKEKMNNKLQKKNTIPTFKNEDEERKFWASHSTIDYLENFAPVEFDLSELKSTLSLLFLHDCVRAITAIRTMRATMPAAVTPLTTPANATNRARSKPSRGN